MQIVTETKCKRFVIIGIVISFKLLIMWLFSSDYQDLMPIPFVNIFLSGIIRMSTIIIMD